MLQVFGVIGENKLYDGSNAGTVVMGGLQTIKNSSAYDIAPGAWIVVEAPDPHDPRKANFPDLPKEKILFQTVPYEPTRTAPSVSLLRTLLVEDGLVSDRQREDLKRDLSHAAEFARDFAAGIKSVAYAGVIAALKSGIVRVTPDGGEGDARVAFDGGASHDAFKEKLGKAFDLAKREPEEKFSWHAADPKDGKDISASQHVLRSLLSGTDFPAVFGNVSTLSGDARNYGSLNKRMISEAVRNGVAEMLGSFRQIDMEQKRRIIGRALSSAAPGQDFVRILFLVLSDLLLTGYLPRVIHPIKALLSRLVQRRHVRPRAFEAAVDRRDDGHARFGGSQPRGTRPFHVGRVARDERRHFRFQREADAGGRVVA